MGILINEFEKMMDSDKSKLGGKIDYQPIYSTGIDVLDYRNGSSDNDGNIRLGIDGGKVLTIVGKSGSGKSTLAVQIACQIVNDYEDGIVIHMDYERAMTEPTRIKNLTGWDDETFNNKYIIRNIDIYSETLYKLVKSLEAKKTDPKVYEQIKVDSGEVDKKGNPIYTLPPTVIIVDSWTTMVPANISEEEELSGSMSASSIAKTNNSVIKRILGPLLKANITLIIVNHITKKIEIGFTKTAADINYLKQDETIPGGSSCIYLSNYLLKLTPSTKMDDKSEKSNYGVKGFQVIGEFLKSRAAESGRQFTLAFSQSEGFMNNLSNLLTLKEEEQINGSPRGYYFGEHEDCKFTTRNFIEKWNEDEELRDSLTEAVENYYPNFIPNSRSSEDIEEDEDDDNEEVTLVRCINKKKDYWMGSDGNIYDGEGNFIKKG